MIERRVEDVAAYIPLKAGMSCRAGLIINYCGDRIADYEVPRVVVCMDEIPTLETGEIYIDGLCN